LLPSEVVILLGCCRALLL